MAEALCRRLTQEAEAESQSTPQQMHQVVIFVHVRAGHNCQDTHYREEPTKEPARHLRGVVGTACAPEVLHGCGQPRNIRQQECADLQCRREEDAGCKVSDRVRDAPGAAFLRGSRANQPAVTRIEINAPISGVHHQRAPQMTIAATPINSIGPGGNFG